MSESNKLSRKRLRLAGQVQGVGFRPFVYRLASELGLSGWVNNDPHGVTIEVQGPPAALETFESRLQRELPPLASISEFGGSAAQVQPDQEAFVIRPSVGGDLAGPGGPTAQVAVDTAVCADCLNELADHNDPRHGYAFINCTNCGPRYTIVRTIPYDRPNTTMADFIMCPLCQGEYDDPRSRRFHAQPIACPTCGPSLWLVDSRGQKIQADDPITAAAEMLAAGKILAIKGLGGFHLACRADNDHVVRRLRRLKQRDAKPFAVMVANLDRVGEYCNLPSQAIKLLAGPLRPIVLLPGLKPSTIASSVAQGLGTLGIMLPYTPLHHLLFARRALAELPLVMTSGNLANEPLVKDNADAIAHLGRIADVLLLHDRPIERSLDDSVVQIHRDLSASVLRRARGYAPAPVPVDLPQADEAPAILAVGAELKNTICLFRGQNAVLSEHIGDLSDSRTYRHFIDTINHLENLFQVKPAAIAADLHPQYLSSDYAMRRHRGQLAGKEPLPIIRVQHHHAHIVSCMAQSGYWQPVIGLACDGTGLGDDGAVWGCEVMRVEVGQYERLGHLRYMPLPGGDAAATQTVRPALAALWDTFGPSMIEMPLARQLAGSMQALEAMVQLLQVGANCPPCSSLGRWFDAIAAMCGLAQENQYEGQAPMALEAACVDGVAHAYDYRLAHDADGRLFQIDLRPMVAQIVNELQASYNVGVIASRFHNTVAAFLLDGAKAARQATGLEVVALSGGCFANRYLMGRLKGALLAEGFEVLSHRDVPCNDGCVALGQAIIASARLAGGKG